MLWNFGDGTTATNLYELEHTWNATGTYSVTLKATNQSSSVTGTVSVTVVALTNYYVKPTGVDTAKGTNWTTAVKTIQAAISIAPVGATIWVTNGTYNTGGLAAGGQLVSNRVVITKPLTLRSVNGPDFTFIEGSNSATTPMRGVYLTDSSVLSGFTVRNGLAPTFSYSNVNYRTRGIDLGGGIYSESPQTRVTNCTIGQAGSGNSATYGGGVYGGDCYDCSILGNQAFNSSYGGGLAYANSYNCTIASNTASLGAGRVPGGTQQHRLCVEHCSRPSAAAPTAHGWIIAR